MRFATFALVSGITLLTACSSQRPAGCIADAEPDLAGAWVHTDSPSVMYTCQPQRLLFRPDGSFQAEYSTESRELGDDDCWNGMVVTGRWSAHEYCASELFLPRTVVRTEPAFPNTHVVIYHGDRIEFMGQASSWYDAEYARER